MVLYVIFVHLLFIIIILLLLFQIYFILFCNVFVLNNLRLFDLFPFPLNI